MDLHGDRIPIILKGTTFLLQNFTEVVVHMFKHICANNATFWELAVLLKHSEY